MKRMITILICSLAINLFAVNFTPFVEPANVPLAEMQSVNNASFMSSGSTHASTISIYEVESSTPEATGRSIRKAPPGKDDGTHDPNNPQFAPIGDAILPLLVLALLYAACMFPRIRRRQTCRITQAE